MRTVSFAAFARLLAGATLIAMGSSTYAASTWNLGGCATATAIGPYSSANTGCTGSLAGNTAHAYAWATTGSGSTFAAATLETSGAGSGFRVKAAGESTDSPQHAMDNSGATKLIAFHFDIAVALDKIILGWTQNDADITVMAYLGAGAPSGFIQGKTVSNLTTGGVASGWALIENSGDVDAGSGDTGGTPASSTDITRTVNGGNVVSSWWLISAYNVGYGGGTLDNLSDFVKILSISSKDVSKVAEPGSLILLSAGLLGLVVVRRRRT
ncbi:exosortase-dependent surface protein XDP1 [Rhodoferax sp.]|uniref:exosortase-dependent surface protein XDP1 n=1 Tax=Rhodoferax sp. TaxID=50421 RepID=UPI00275C7529|nr:exosortase-dependent surface protein XDP1 [Rhodoferax sp.]